MTPNPKPAGPIVTAPGRWSRLYLLPLLLLALGAVGGRVGGWLWGARIAGRLAVKGPLGSIGWLDFTGNFFAPIFSSGDNLALGGGLAGLVLSLLLAARWSRKAGGGGGKEGPDAPAAE